MTHEPELGAPIDVAASPYTFIAYLKIPQRAVDPSDPADVEEAAERLAASAPKEAERPVPPAEPVPA